ncbi:MAG: rod-binding protein [Proteobacteria bacterium]|nr:rod-binding protein [Pseudomonadota bacterium]
MNGVLLLGHWLKHTSSVSWQDRGVLRCGNSRMEFLESRLLNSSQGTRKRKVFERFGLFRHMMCRIAGNSSIQSLIIILTLGGNLRAQENPQSLTRQQQYEKIGSAFESIFLQQLYSQMKMSGDSMNESASNLFRKSNAEKIFESMRDQAFLEQVARQNPIGIKDLVVRQLEGKGGVPKGALLQ